MRNFSLFIIALLALASCGADHRASSAKSGNSMMAFADSIFDFGRFGGAATDLVRTHEFTFTNVGDSTLVINRVEPSCHCLTVEYTRKPVAHGEKGFVRLIYDGAENKKTTHFYRTAVVYSNASNSPVTLVVEGEVERE